MQFVTILGLDVIAYYIVIKYVRKTRWTASKDKDTEMENLDIVEQAIMAALEEQPFSSMRDLSKRTFIPLSTVHQ
jgi:hypothetical protein